MTKSGEIREKFYRFANKYRILFKFKVEYYHVCVKNLVVQGEDEYIPFIKHEENRKMENESTRKKLTLKPWHGVVWFIVVLVALLFGGSYVQYHYGMLGLAITELGLAVMGLLPLLIFDVRLKDMLPIRIPKVRHVIGTILMWMGTFLLSTLLTLVIASLFPASMAETAGALGGFMTSVPWILSFFIIAVMPAVCEEILHRGFLLTSMRSIKKDWLIVLIMGLIFGIFHLDPIRFAGTAILGAALAYIMVKTKNFLLPFLMHLINNSLSLFVTFSNKSAIQNVDAGTMQSQISPSNTIGVYLVLGAAIPLLITAAVYLLTKKDKNAAEPAAARTPKRSFLLPFLISLGIGAVMLISGIAILAASVMSDMVDIHTSDHTVNDNTAPYVQTFTIEKEKVYTMSYSFHSEIGVIEMTIQDEQGNVLYDVAAGEITGNNQITLKKGTYTATFRFLISEYEAYAEEKGYPYTDEDKAALHLDGDLDAKHSAQISLILM